MNDRAMKHRQHLRITQRHYNELKDKSPDVLYEIVLKEDEEGFVEEEAGHFKTYNPNAGNGNGDQQIGLTKREYFAAMAMQGMLANGNLSDWNYTAKNAIRHADTLLKELEK